MTRLVLVGAGHAHALVLRDWIAAPLPGVDLALVSPQPQAPYSGMLPGWLAGAYGFDEICIDFVALARAAGARFVQDEVVQLDAAQRQLRLASGETLGYELLSLNIGSTLTPPVQAQAQAQVPGMHVLSLRPIDHLHQAWQALLAQWRAGEQLRHGEAGAPPFRVTTVGGGAAGVEATLAVLARLRGLQPARALQGRLLTRSTTLLPGMAGGAARAAQRALAAAGVAVATQTDFDPADAQATDLLLWATGAQAHDWPRTSGLQVSPSGFIAIDATLRNVSHPEVFAVGDCAEWQQPLPKAGVYAVRMGPVLARNLRAALQGAALSVYRPQRRYLALLACADGRAIASWGRWSAQGRWLWRCKDRIDRGFVRGFDAAASTPPAGRRGASDRGAAG